MTVPLVATIIFAIRAWQGLSPWAYALYCLIAEALPVLRELSEDDSLVYYVGKEFNQLRILHG